MILGPRPLAFNPRPTLGQLISRPVGGLARPVSQSAGWAGSASRQACCGWPVGGPARRLVGPSVGRLVQLGWSLVSHLLAPSLVHSKLRSLTSSFTRSFANLRTRSCGFSLLALAFDFSLQRAQKLKRRRQEIGLNVWSIWIDLMANAHLKKTD